MKRRRTFFVIFTIVAIAVLSSNRKTAPRADSAATPLPSPAAQESNPSKYTPSMAFADDDFSPEKIDETLWKIVNRGIGYKDSIQEIVLEEGLLTISVQLQNDGIIPTDLLAETRASSITDCILDYPTLDSYWSSVHLDFQYCAFTFTHDMVEGTGNLRYIDYETIVQQRVMK